MNCQFCDRDVVQPFQCSYCDEYFRLGLPAKPPFWYQKRKLVEEQSKEITSIPVHVMPTETRKSPKVAGFLLIGLIVGVAIGSFSWHFLIALPNIQRWQQQSIQLKTDLDTAIKEKDALEINLGDLQSEITKLEDEKHALERELSSLEAEYSVLQTHYKNLEKQYEDLDRKYEELFSDYDRVEWVLTYFFDRPLAQKEVPSISDVRAWLNSDRTDQFRYTDPDFVCGDFAVMLAIHARAKHWDMGVIAVLGYETETHKEFNHAFNAIITMEGLVYVEPQADDVWWYENHEEIRKGETYEIWTYETMDVYVEDVQLILSY